jgi:hypothetical protein
MSIREEWKMLLQEERLHRLDPYPGDPRKRTVLMTPSIHNLAVVGPWDDEEMGDRCARLLATLQRIVRGAHLIVCLEPFAAREAQLGRLDDIKDAVFDIRSREQPGLRVFCRFAERDVLVAFTCAPRSVKVSWLDKLPLGDRHSKEWRKAVRECIEQWTMYFPKHDPVMGDDLNAYLSDATLE